MRDVLWAVVGCCIWIVFPVSFWTAAFIAAWMYVL
jgi:hypothetical protein